MGEWEFKREEQQFEVLPEGKYRIRIKSAEKAISKNGNDMLTLQFEVSGSNKILYHYIVFLNDKPEITNRMLTQFFDSFAGIPEGDFDMANWIGKVGAAKLKHDEYDGRIKEKISWFIPVEKQDDVPAWVEPEGSDASPSPVSGFAPLGDDDVPF